MKYFLLWRLMLYFFLLCPANLYTLYYLQNYLCPSLGGSVLINLSLFMSPPVSQLWPCAAHENSHQIILTKEQHLLQRATDTLTQITAFSSRTQLQSHTQEKRIGETRQDERTREDTRDEIIL